MYDSCIHVYDNGNESSTFPSMLCFHVFSSMFDVCLLSMFEICSLNKAYYWILYVFRSKLVINYEGIIII